MGVVVGTEGKAGQDARVFQDVAYHEADDDEHHDAAPAVTDGSVNERERNRDQQHDGDWDTEPECDVGKQGHGVGCSENPADRGTKPLVSLSHFRPPPARRFLWSMYLR